MAISYPTVSLQPGSTNSAAVKQLQDYLVSVGAMTQAQVNSGYGTYGPQTTQAVQTLQQKLGVDNSTGPGYWGPLTIAKVQATPQKTTTASGGSTNTASVVSPQKAVLLAISDVAKTAATTGKPPVSFAEALDLASKDPTIVAKYADVAKLDQQGFQQQIQSMQSLYSTQADQQKMQFEQDRKQLSEQQAAAGTAYSGFRGKAQENLAQTEAGIVTSTRSQQQQALNSLTSQFEAKYGTDALPKASLNFIDPFAANTTLSGLDTVGGGTTSISGQEAEGITGSTAPAMKSDINQQALYNYQTAKLPV